MVHRPHSSAHRLALAIALALTGCQACGHQAPPPEPSVSTDASVDRATVAPAPGGAPTAHMLVGESPQAVVSWTRATEQERSEDLGMVADVVFGQRLFVRVVVTGVPDGVPMDLQGQMRLRAPDGRLLHEQDIQAVQEDVDSEAPGVLVMLPGMDMVFDPGDPPGAYRMEGTVSIDQQVHEVHSELRVADGGLQLDPAMEL